MDVIESAYVHVPFCRHRCGYCNFTLITQRDDLIPAYMAALESEMTSALDSPQSVSTLFLGGGTPSYLPADELSQLLSTLSRWLSVRPDGEYSCEVNPLDCTPERLEVLQQFGVNRISLGGQSFDTAKLSMLERDHTGEQLERSLQLCSRYFANVSLDLIFAAPGETLEGWQSDIQRALGSPIQHLSTYGLTIERGAAFFGRLQKQELSELDADLQIAMYEHAIKELKSAGWEHYEVSSFAKPGFRCRHNENYWQGNPWWAFGPGAASFLPCPDGQGVFERRVNHRSTTAYLKKIQSGESPVAEIDKVTPEQAIRERLVFGLRRIEGVDLDALEEDWSGPIRELFEPYLSRYVEEGWLEFAGHARLKLTRRGLLISDSLWPDLLMPNS